MRSGLLVDVVARRRLRASRSIIDQATRTARASRMAFENILRTCSSEIDADFDTMRFVHRAHMIHHFPTSIF